MSKKQIIDELTTLLAVSLRHKIGSIANKNEVYAEKYAKDAEIFFREAGKVNENANWSYNDKIEIKQELIGKLRKELEQKKFISDEKYDLIDIEVENALKELNII
jgi:hypothetical protein